MKTFKKGSKVEVEMGDGKRIKAILHSKPGWFRPVEDNPQKELGATVMLKGECIYPQLVDVIYAGFIKPDGREVEKCGEDVWIAVC